MAQDPAVGGTALEAWRAIAITVITGLTAVLVALAKAALAQRKQPSPGQGISSEVLRSAEERAEICARLETVEAEVDRLRQWKHDEVDNNMHAVLGGLELMKLELKHLRELLGDR